VHIAFVVDSGRVIEYVNGREVARKTVQPVSFSRANGEDLYVGIQRNPEAGLEYWYPLNGAIDELRFYDRALTAAEVRALSEVAGPVPPDIGFWERLLAVVDRLKVYLLAGVSLVTLLIYLLQQL